MASRENTNNNLEGSKLERKIQKTYVKYPPEMPFINTDYRRESGETIKALPETKREAVLSALRNLKEKMRRFEIDDKSSATQGSRNISSHVSPHVSPVNISHYEGNFIEQRDSDHAVEGSGLFDKQVSVESAAHRQVSDDEESDVSDVNVRSTRWHDDLRDVDDVIVIPECLNENRGFSPGKTENSRLSQPVKSGILEWQHGERESIDYTAQLSEQRLKDLRQRQITLLASQALEENKVRELESRLHEDIIDMGGYISQQTSKPDPRSRVIAEKSADPSAGGHVTWDETPVSSHVTQGRQGLTRQNRSDRAESSGRGGRAEKQMSNSTPARRLGNKSKTMGKRRTRSSQRRNNYNGNYNSNASEGYHGRNDDNHFNKMKNSEKRKDKSSERRILIEKPVPHFNIALAELPFINGKSVGPSHSVNANLQQVIALIKQGHSPLVCRPQLSSLSARRCACCSTIKPSHENQQKFSSERLKRTEADESVTSHVDLLEDDVNHLLDKLKDDYAAIRHERDDILQSLSDDESSTEMNETVARLSHQLEIKAEEIVIAQRISIALQKTNSLRTKSTPEVSLVSSHSGGGGRHRPELSSGGRSCALHDSGVFEETGEHIEGQGHRSADRGYSRLELYKELRRLQSLLKNEASCLDC